MFQEMDVSETALIQYRSDPQQIVNKKLFTNKQVKLVFSVHVIFITNIRYVIFTKIYFCLMWE